MSSSRRLKCFAINMEATSYMFRGNAFRFLHMPKDVRVERFSYSAQRDSVLVLMSSDQWPEVSAGSEILIEEVTIEDLGVYSSEDNTCSFLRS